MCIITIAKKGDAMPLSLRFGQPGSYTIDDNGVPGDNTSVIRDGDGVVIFALAHPVDQLCNISRISRCSGAS
jgi:hypothetical protein